jgi:hypothetical protein
MMGWSGPAAAGALPAGSCGAAGRLQAGAINNSASKQAMRHVGIDLSRSIFCSEKYPCSR